METFSMEVGGRTLTIEQGKMAKQANGAVLVRYGDTVVLVSATASKEPREGVDGLDISGAHVGGGDDAQLAAALGEGLQLWEDEDQAAPFDEGNEEVKAV